jgi:hypothetical protein
MKSRHVQPVNEGERCRRFDWIQYEFDKNVTARMPVLQAASYKEAEGRVHLRTVSRWIEKRKAEEEARRLRAQACYVEGRLEEGAARDLIVGASGNTGHIGFFSLGRTSGKAFQQKDFQNAALLK